VLCERTPGQAVNTNIIGCQNVISAATKAQVEKVIFTSSDKAVNPTNVMGTSKLMGERLMTAANSCKKGDGPIFTSTRFGNVLGSNGSVIPIFHNQIAKGGPVSLTERDMTRFVMSLEQAVSLVIDSSSHAKGGEVFITKMPVMRIEDLACVMIDEIAPAYGYNPADININVIGSKPGEKLYEELMSDEETRRAIELESYFVVTPAFRGIYHDIAYDYQGVISEEVTNPYISANETVMSRDEIASFLTEHQLLMPPQETMSSRYWPGDKEENK
jgi:FlaA1/EpsC-like NDP-sugar epimerase